MPPYPPWQRALAADRFLSQPKTAEMSRKAAETPKKQEKKLICPCGAGNSVPFP
jgi:hypothetical protein